MSESGDPVKDAAYARGDWMCIRPGCDHYVLRRDDICFNCCRDQLAEYGFGVVDWEEEQINQTEQMPKPEGLEE